ncbi:uncharacterized protein (TIGR00743 family) [Bisgaardia hudsonensis]|uniref:Uncharacterized protein (TIGR00743 family) n=1 Tax=Bisgaardia hudsonensis TaxID=109472 RepID=A0A4R2N2A3_9PAST|nr:DUF406 family protein [Bisgaardia hudsonensis]QLB12412.1 hypothetical protein A6A11_01685 [Bisgaardia hudsonensis]TCP13939.1 uncharacterized protein (TIGR00743 family) [Bisgaardia hudsonensis]
MKTFSDEADCCRGSCRTKTTAMFDNEDTSLEIIQVYSTEQEAREVLEQLMKKAHSVENEPCEIESQILEIENGFELYAKFNFSCQAESVLFQLALR